MSSNAQRQRLLVFIGLGFLVVNLVVFLIYRNVYAGQVDDLEEEVNQVRIAQTRWENRGAELQVELAEATVARDAITQLYRESFSTERERLTDMLREVRRLASEARLDPGQISYPEEDVRDQDLLRKRVVFSVEGDYQQLRTYINLLELTEQFVILEEITLTDATPKLRINLRLATLFTDPEGLENLEGS